MPTSRERLHCLGRRSAAACRCRARAAGRRRARSARRTASPVREAHTARHPSRADGRATTRSASALEPGACADSGAVSTPSPAAAVRCQARTSGRGPRRRCHGRRSPGHRRDRHGELTPRLVGEHRARHGCALRLCSGRRLQHRRTLPRRSYASTTAGRPSVSVPVLSNAPSSPITISSASASSRDAARRRRRCGDDRGRVARPSAHGHAVTSTRPR